MSLVKSLLGGWLCVNGLLDFGPLGLAPLLGVTLPGLSINAMFPAFGTGIDFRHRAIAYAFMTCGGMRFAAGWTKKEEYVRMAAFSYAVELLMMCLEVFHFRSTTFEAAAGGFVVPAFCLALVACGVMDDGKSDAKKAAKKR